MKEWFESTNLEVNQLSKCDEIVLDILTKAKNDGVEYYVLTFEYPYDPELKSVLSMKFGQFITAMRDPNTTLLEIRRHNN